MKYIRLLRVHQWIKNLFIFIPAFFGGVLSEFNVVVSLIQGFLCFSLVASSVYILNDYRDIENDRKHPEKKARPLASGEVTKIQAILILGCLGPLGLVWSYAIDLNFFFCLVIYSLINIAYSLGLKNISILDIMIVAVGFLLRTISGGFVIGIEISSWLVIMVFLLALFLAFAKRRDDLLITEQSGQVLRKVSKNYNMEFVTSGLSMISAIIIVSYVMYSLSPEVMKKFDFEYVYFTSVFVIAGVLRYLQLCLVENDSASPTKIFYSDRFIQVTLLCWMMSFFFIIYY
ncbi:MAG: decaprenyl-phosphate phosphoribosyltransferase [Bacteroidota bacterium]